MIPRADILTSNLCAEIDELRADVRYWKEQSEYWRVQHGEAMRAGRMEAAALVQKNYDAPLRNGSPGPITQAILELNKPTKRKHE